MFEQTSRSGLLETFFDMFVKLHHLLRRRTLLCLVLVDAEAALSSIEVKELLYEHDIYLLAAPGGLGWMILPCDQRAHSVMKRSYYVELSILPPASGALPQQLKFELWRRAFWSVRPEVIRSYFNSAGITSREEETRSVIERLFSEGQRCAVKYLPLHRKQLAAYLIWKRKDGASFKYLTSQLHTLKGGPFHDLICSIVLK